MTWNYRVMRQLGSDGKPYYAIHEVFYGEEGNKPGWTKEPVDVGGESLTGVRQTLEWMALALDKPVLDYETGEEISTTPEPPR